MSYECKCMLSSWRSALGRGWWPPFRAGRAQDRTCLAFLRGASSWTIPISQAWGSSQGQRDVSHIQHLQSHSPSPRAVHQDTTCQGLCVVWDRHYPMNITSECWGDGLEGGSWEVRVSTKPSWPIRMPGVSRGTAWLLWAPCSILYITGTGCSSS